MYQWWYRLVTKDDTKFNLEKLIMLYRIKNFQSCEVDVFVWQGYQFGEARKGPCESEQTSHFSMPIVI